MASTQTQLDARREKSRFRRWLLLLLLFLGAIATLLTYQAYRQIRWEAFYQHKVMAEELLARVGQTAAAMVQNEEARSFSDYAFLTVRGDDKNNVLQRSPLSEFPVVSQLPGAIGYFQVDSQGQLTSPLFDADVDLSRFGISDAEQQQRLTLFNSIQQVLSGNHLLTNDGGELEVLLPSIADPGADLRRRLGNRDNQSSSADTESMEATAPTIAEPRAESNEESAFDRLNAPASQSDSYDQSLGRVDELLQLEDAFEEASVEAEANRKATRGAKYAADAPRAKRREQSTVVESKEELQRQLAKNSYGNVPIQVFESEVDPFDWSLLNSGHFVLFRKVWRDDQRFVQGLLIDSERFVQEVMLTAFRNTALSDMSELVVAHNGNVLSVIQDRADAARYLSSIDGVKGTLLHRQFLPSPLNATELILTVQKLPVGPGGRVLLMTAGVLGFGLLTGFWFIYRLGSQQIDAAQQQRDFVSSVSHELKTPLTSIRMYGEMLKSGWASDDKKSEYYDYIHDESERLSRLIENVLQMARMAKGQLNLSLEPVSGASLIDNLVSKLSSQTERAGFGLDLCINESLEDSLVRVDKDAFMQIFINLVDNAIKFSAKSENKTVQLVVNKRIDQGLEVTVRDFGPGIPNSQLKKIFTQFYRLENEMTRNTAGTGIGLALVHQLVSAMGGTVDVLNTKPGASFVIQFPGNDPTH